MRDERTIDQRGASREGDGELEQLLAAAGPRPAVPEASMRRLKAVAREEWQRSLATEPRRWRLAPLALAATLALAAVGGWWWWRTGLALGPAVAAVEARAGEVTRSDEPLAGSRLASGDEIATGAGASLALRMAGGPSVRLDERSRVRLEGPAALRLVAGAVYVDSGPEPGHGTVEIATAFGSVREIGTQYEVRIANGGDPALRVRVREGAVTVRHDGGVLTAERGEEVTVREAGEIERAGVPLAGPAWEWAVAAAPALDIEGARLDDYLDWVSRETGRPVRFVDAEVASAAATIELHGSIEGLGPEESLAALVPGSGLVYSLEPDGAILVGRPGRDGG